MCLCRVLCRAAVIPRTHAPFAPVTVSEVSQSNTQGLRMAVRAPDGGVKPRGGSPVVAPAAGGSAALCPLSPRTTWTTRAKLLSGIRAADWYFHFTRTAPQSVLTPGHGRRSHPSHPIPLRLLGTFVVPSYNQRLLIPFAQNWIPGGSPLPIAFLGTRNAYLCCPQTAAPLAPTLVSHNHLSCPSHPRQSAHSLLSTARRRVAISNCDSCLPLFPSLQLNALLRELHTTLSYNGRQLARAS